MAMVANNPSAAKRVGIPQSVGQDFMAADKGKKFGGGQKSRADSQVANRPKTNQGKNEMFSKGGPMKEESKAMVKKEVGFMKKAGAPKSMIKHEMAEMKGMKSGGRVAVKGEHPVQKQAKRGAQMIKMASGGLTSGHKSADGIAQRGKTKGAKPTMSGGAPLGMKRGGKC
jgi:hypothetical protein